MAPTIIIAAGALIFIMLGVLHLKMTVEDMKEPRKFAPARRELLEDLQNTRMNFRKDLKSFWETSLGFHFSHSIGVIFYGFIVAYCAVLRPDIFSDMFLRIAFVLFGASYVLIARKFWFIIPFAGALIGTTLIAIGLAMLH